MNAGDVAQAIEVLCVTQWALPLAILDNAW
jgi:hypothetical protein